MVGASGSGTGKARGCGSGIDNGMDLTGAVVAGVVVVVGGGVVGVVIVVGVSLVTLVSQFAATVSGRCTRRGGPRLSVDFGDFAVSCTATVAGRYTGRGDPRLFLRSETLIVLMRGQ